MVARTVVVATVVGVLSLGIIAVILGVGLATTPAAKPGNCDAPKNISVLSAQITPYISPDTADEGFTTWTLDIALNLSGSTVDPTELMLDVGEPYRNKWMQLVGRKGFNSNGVLHTTGHPPKTPGFYEGLKLLITYGNGICEPVTLAETKVNIDVTCSATILDSWCDGERRWIPAENKCVRTYKPCGQETAAGVNNTNACTRYPCYNNNRTCGQYPEGGDTCISCTPIAVCEPNCTNVDSSVPQARVCGDDGCDGICGPLQSGNGCDPNAADGRTSCDGTTGQCVTATIGSCLMPYNLFAVNLTRGNPRLNAQDQDGIRVWMLNNTSTETTEPIVEVTSGTSLPAGWPVDGITVPKGGIRVRVFLNTFYYSDTITSSSNAVGTSDVTFQFRIGNSTVQGMEAYLLDQTGDTGPNSRDMFMSLVQEDCTDFVPGSPNFTPADQYESDDASPPGGYGSQIVSTGLSTGVYKIVVSTYSQNNAGPAWLEVVFTDATEGPCAPLCQGHICGDNNCGGVCNVKVCDDGLSCNNGRCTNCGASVPKDCTKYGSENYPDAPYNDPNYTYTAECGSDSGNCGYTCGTRDGGCPPGSLCQLEMGVCIPVPNCDHNVPECTGTPGAGKKKKRQGGQYYCDVFCEWRELNDPLPDIIPNGEMQMLPTYLVQWKSFDTLSCAYEEKCLFGPGRRLIARFNTDIMNVGRAKFTGVNQYQRPDIVQFAQCHQHPHLKGFAQFDLRHTDTGAVVVKSTKQSYCVEATEQYQYGPGVPCSSEASCQDQGLDAGWIDRYDRYLDCQWLDITELYDNHALNQWLTYHISVNNGRPIVEYSYINNAVEFPVFHPCAPPVTNQLEIVTYLANQSSVCCSRPGGTSSACEATGCASATPPSPNACNYNL